MRYNVDLSVDSVLALNPKLKSEKKIETLTEMDAPENMVTLHRLGALAGERDVLAGDFAGTFDLPRS